MTPHSSIRRALRPALLRAAALLFSAAFLLSIPGVVGLIDAAVRTRLLAQIAAGGIAQRFLHVNLLMYVLVRVLFLFFSGLTAAAFWLALGRRSRAWGLALFTGTAKILQAVIRGIPYLVPIPFVILFVRATIYYARKNQPFSIFSMAFSELFMLVLAGGVLWWLYRFLDNAADSAALISYVSTLDRPELWVGSQLTSTSLFVLAGVCIGLAVVRRQDAAGVAAYLCGAAALTLSGVWLCLFRRDISRLRWAARS